MIQSIEPQIWTPKKPRIELAGRGCGSGAWLRQKRAGAGGWTPEVWGADRLWDFTADDTDTVAGGNITTFYDQGPGGYDATIQSGTCPLAIDATLNNQLAATVSYDRFAIDIGFTYGGTSYSYWVVGHNYSTNPFQAIAYCSTGTTPLVAMTVPDRAGFLDGGSYEHFGIGTSIVGAQTRIWSFTATDAKFYSPAGQVGLTRPNTANPFTTQSYLFNNAGVGLPLQNYRIGRVVLLNRIPTIDDFTNWFGWCSS